MKQTLWAMERLLFSYVQMRGQSTVRTGELVSPLQLTASRDGIF